MTSPSAPSAVREGSSRFGLEGGRRKRQRLRMTAVIRGTRSKAPASVIPAKAGIHFDFFGKRRRSRWVPAFAGTTMVWMFR
jgi:hypothetical protein